MKKPKKRAPQAWRPEKAAYEQQITMQQLIEKVVEARGVGLQSHEEVAHNVLKCDVQTWLHYRESDPNSPISIAYARARARRSAFLKAKASAIAGDDKNPRQADMLKYLLGRPGVGGDEFQDKMEVTGKDGGPIKADIALPSAQQLMKQLYAEANGKKRKV